MARFVPALLALALLGCGDNQDPAGAARLWRDIHRLEYRSWQRAPGYEQRRLSDAPHGGSVDIYVNDIVADALAAGEPLEAWPAGSVIVKDGYSSISNAHALVAAMEKRADAWFWAEWDEDGDAAYSGTPELCTDCHDRGDDAVRAFALP
jgi:hypothetical protein